MKFFFEELAWVLAMACVTALSVVVICALAWFAVWFVRKAAALRDPNWVFKTPQWKEMKNDAAMLENSLKQNHPTEDTFETYRTNELGYVFDKKKHTLLDTAMRYHAAWNRLKELEP